MRYKHTTQWLREKIKSCKELLADKDWAKGDNDYHRDCRVRLQKELEEYESVLKRLTR